MIGYRLRAAKWTAFVPLALTAVLYLIANRSVDDPQHALDTMRVITVLLALGCCAALDDPAAPTLAASPTRLRRRRAQQAAATLVPAALLWGIGYTLTIARSGAAGSASGLLIESAGLFAITCTIALVAQRLGRQAPGPIVGSGFMVAVLVILGLPHPITLLPALGDPTWQAAHQRWTVLLAVLIAVAALTTRDPAGQGISSVPRRAIAPRRGELTDE